MTLGVPPDTGPGLLDLALPVGAVGMHSTYVARQDRVAQRPLEQLLENGVGLHDA